MTKSPAKTRKIENRRQPRHAPFFFLGRLVLRCCGRSSSLSSYFFFSAFLFGREESEETAGAATCLGSPPAGAFCCCCWAGFEEPRCDEDCEELVCAPPAPAVAPVSAAAFSVFAFFLEGAMARLGGVGSCFLLDWEGCADWIDRSSAVCFESDSEPTRPHFDGTSDETGLA